jgi:aspartate racemase
MNRTSQTIGMVGGTSPFSTVEYYLGIVKLHQEAFGDSSFPRMVIASVSFQQYVDMQHAGDWDGIAAGYQREFDALAAAGADLLAITANTMHRILPKLSTHLEVVTVYEALGREAEAMNAKTIGLTGTRFTMSDAIYRAALEAQGLTVIVPDPGQQDRIHEMIFENLVRGIASDRDGQVFEAIACNLLDRGADAVALACTELKLLPMSAPTKAKSIDTAHVHAKLLWERAIGERLVGG